MNCVFFADSLHGWIAGNDGKIFRSKDGGETWTFCNLPPSIQDNNIRSLCFTNLDTGWAVGDMGLIHTIDGGNSWNTDSLHSGHSVFFHSKNHGWVGDFGKIHHQIDDNTWEEQPFYQDKEIRSIYFIDSLTGWAVGYSEDSPLGILLKTNNGGLLAFSLSSRKIAYTGQNA